MKNKTAVEYLEDQFEKFVAWFEGDPASGEFTLNDMYKAIHQAIELEKQQIIQAYKDALVDKFYDKCTDPKYYFKKTYKKNKTDGE
jgi:DnaJ-domain-containing protein 1